MKPIKRVLHPKVWAELEKCDLPWSTKKGNKHIRLYICDHLVAIFPAVCLERDRNVHNLRGEIRAFIRRYKKV